LKFRRNTMKRLFYTCVLSTLPLVVLAADPDAMQDMDIQNQHTAMHGFYGQYPMTRESSGTAWMPDSSPMEGIHSMNSDWMTMVHGYADVIYDNQGGKRGENKTFNESMLMGMASHPFGGGTIGFRGMMSLDPLMGKDGYPLMLQTGET